MIHLSWSLLSTISTNEDMNEFRYNLTREEMRRLAILNKTITKEEWKKSEVVKKKTTELKQPASTGSFSTTATCRNCQMTFVPQKKRSKLICPECASANRALYKNAIMTNI